MCVVGLSSRHLSLSTPTLTCLVLMDLVRVPVKGSCDTTAYKDILSTTLGWYGVCIILPTLILVLTVRCSRTVGNIVVIQVWVEGMVLKDSRSELKRFTILKVNYDQHISVCRHPVTQSSIDVT